jgi:hypothetical protein
MIKLFKKLTMMDGDRADAAKQRKLHSFERVSSFCNTLTSPESRATASVPFEPHTLFQDWQLETAHQTLTESLSLSTSMTSPNVTTPLHKASSAPKMVQSLVSSPIVSPPAITSSRVVTNEQIPAFHTPPAPSMNPNRTPSFVLRCSSIEENNECTNPFLTSNETPKVAPPPPINNNNNNKMTQTDQKSNNFLLNFTTTATGTTNAKPTVNRTKSLLLTTTTTSALSLPAANLQQAKSAPETMKSDFCECQTSRRVSPSSSFMAGNQSTSENSVKRKRDEFLKATMRICLVVSPPSNKLQVFRI